jgi:hypothetical protein
VLLGSVRFWCGFGIVAAGLHGAVSRYDPKCAVLAMQVDLCAELVFHPGTGNRSHAREIQPLHGFRRWHTLRVAESAEFCAWPSKGATPTQEPNQRALVHPRRAILLVHRPELRGVADTVGPALGETSGGAAAGAGIRYPQLPARRRRAPRRIRPPPRRRSPPRRRGRPVGRRVEPHGGTRWH